MASQGRAMADYPISKHQSFLFSCLRVFSRWFMVDCNNKPVHLVNANQLSDHQ